MAKRRQQPGQAKRALDLRASVELLGVNPTVAGQTSPEPPATQPRNGKPSLTASVHMPASEAKRLNLIRKRPEQGKPRRTTLKAGGDPKQELFWDSLLTRTVDSSRAQTGVPGVKQDQPRRSRVESKRSQEQIAAEPLTRNIDM